MGIKFHCPNGHRLNVKTFLAGKRGICPHCGAKVVIPTSSNLEGPQPATGMPASAAQEMPAGAVPAWSMPAAAPLGPYAAHQPYQPVQPAAPAMAHYGGSQPAGPQVVGAAPAGIQIAAPVAAIAHAAPAPAAAPLAADPIDEAPTAVWYVRPASGGQFGPARGDIMRKWLGEGRVSADSLVWREGWADWKTARGVFPSLGGGPANGVAAAATPVGIAPISPVSAPSMVSTGTSSSSSPRPRKKSGGMSLLIVALLGILSVALLVALVFVVQSLNG